MELVRTHRVELAVLGGLTAPAELESEPLVDDEIVLVGPLRLAGRRLRAKELEGETWIARDEGRPPEATSRPRAGRSGCASVRALELPSWEAVKLAVASGAGIAAISRCALDAGADGARLVVLDVPRWRLTRTISLVTARDVPLTPTAERFRGLLRDAFRPREEPPPNSNLPGRHLARRPGRRGGREVAALRAAGRLVTLTGAGGSGKTRLAVEAAAALVDEFADGVYFVDLAPLREPDLVPGAIAGALGLPDADELDERLRERELLLVLDNLEQLVDAAAAIAALLAAAPRLRILATSRVPLRIAGEHELRVEPLALDDAVALFEQRARAVRPGFVADASLATVCERLDRLPLALELAAARVRTLPAAGSPRGSSRRLRVLVGGRRDADERQRTLRATIAWSYDLLAEPERAAFARPGGLRRRLRRRRGAGGVRRRRPTCTRSPTRPARGDADGRFRMLELVRELAEEELAAGGESAPPPPARGALPGARARGAAVRPWPGGGGLARAPGARARQRAAALRWAVDADPGLGLALAEALEPLWVRGLRQREGLRWLELLLDAATARRPTCTRARWRSPGGCRASSAIRRARPLHERALALAREAGDDRRAAWALHGLGDVARERASSPRP